MGSGRLTGLRTPFRDWLHAFGCPLSGGCTTASPSPTHSPHGQFLDECIRWAVWRWSENTRSPLHVCQPPGGIWLPPRSLPHSARSRPRSGSRRYAFMSCRFPGHSYFVDLQAPGSWLPRIHRACKPRPHHTPPHIPHTTINDDKKSISV